MADDRDPDEAGWPKDVHGITQAGLGKLGVQDGTHALHWDGVPLVTKNTIRLEGWSFVLALIATIATAIAALWPIAVHLGWFGLKAAFGA